MPRTYTYKDIRKTLLDEGGENWRTYCEARERHAAYAAAVHGQVPVDYNAITGECKTEQRSLGYALTLRKVLKRLGWYAAYPTWRAALNGAIREMRKVPVTLD